MNNDSNYILNIYKTTLSDADFAKLSKFIYDNYGIKLPLAKKTMLQSRLLKRLRSLNMTTFSEYTKYLFSTEGLQNEVLYMIDEVSTNKTDFFRENAHFEFMTNELLPYFLKHNITNLNVWSAAASSGEEIYTLGMVLSEFKEKNPVLNFSLLGSDISKTMLSKAISAIYPETAIAPVPLELKRKYFLRSKDKDAKTVRVIPKLREKATFQLLNLMNKVYETKMNQFDIIFCRNVLIYFDRETQEKVLTRLIEKLKHTGFIFLGHSESITNMKLNVKQVKPTIFIKGT
jgi:chemotaxis protein methyltransferase CheR